MVDVWGWGVTLFLDFSVSLPQYHFDVRHRLAHFADALGVGHLHTARIALVPDTTTSETGQGQRWGWGDEEGRVGCGSV